MRISIGNDHRGVEVKNILKEYLNNLGYEVINEGTDSVESIDYPVIASKVSNDVISGKADLGIVICGTGIGMSIACNKIKGIRCAKVSNEEEAKYTRLHNNANILAISANTDIELLKNIVKTFVNTEFSNEERHIRRLKQIEDLENA